jgi:adenylosuccinate lyase
MSVSVFEMAMLRDLWSSDELRQVFEERNRFRKWLDVEIALAEAQAGLGIIPPQVVDDFRKVDIAGVDLDRVNADVRKLKHSLVPVLKEFQRQCPDASGQWMHYGATTQDILDTGLVLQIKEAHTIILRDLHAVGDELARLASAHRDTVMAGRTHAVQALPITFGHKCAIWLDEVARHHQRLKECAPRIFTGMMVGAVGTQAAFGPRAREIETRALAALGLNAPDISWAPARDRFAEYLNILAMLGATLAKIGNEILNLARNEFAEVEEGFNEGKLGSSTMPHKRNPVGAENLVGLARALRYHAALMVEAMVQEHERDGVAWKTEWRVIPESCMIAGGMLMQTVRLLKGLLVDPQAMARNLDIMQGYLLSERVMLELGHKAGKQNAHHWVYEAAMRGIEQKQGFAEALRGHPNIQETFSDADIATLTDPKAYVGEAGPAVDRVIASARATWLPADG